MDDSAAGGELVAPDVRVAAIAVRGHLLRPARRPREHIGRLRREPPFWAGERTARPYRSATKNDLLRRMLRALERPG